MQKQLIFNSGDTCLFAANFIRLAHFSPIALHLQLQDWDLSEETQWYSGIFFHENYQSHKVHF